MGLKKIISTVLLFATLFSLCGCVFVERTDVEIGGNAMWDFFWSEDDKKESFFKKNEKEFDFAKFQDTFFLARFKLLYTDTEGYIALYAGAYSVDEEKTFVVKRASLVTESGNVICEEEDLDLEIKPANFSDILSGGCRILDCKLTDDWYYDDSDLILTVVIEGEGESKELTYEVSVFSNMEIPYY